MNHRASLGQFQSRPQPLSAKEGRVNLSQVVWLKIGVFALACLGFGKEAKASDWADWASEWANLKASLTQQIQYNDNMTYSSTQKQAAFGYFLSPSLQASHNTESFDISVKAQGSIKRYDNPLWDCENYTLGLNSQYKTRRSIFKMVGGYGISCAYSSQSQETGVIVPGVQSTNYNLAPSWMWQWTARSQLSLGAAYTNRSYTSSSNSTAKTSSTAPTSYTNYDSYSINLGLNYAWDRELSLNGGLYFMDSQYQGSNASTQRSIGLQLGGKYVISPYWTANFSAGLRRTDIQYASNAPNSSSMSPLGNASLSYIDRLSKFSIGYSSTIVPSALGQTLQTQSVYARYSYKLTPHLMLNINTNLLQSLPIGGQASSGTTTSAYGRNSVNSSVAFIWDFAANWQLKGSYAFLWQKLQQQGPAEGNVVTLSLSYALDEIEELAAGKYNMFDDTTVVHSSSTENHGLSF